MEDIDIWRAAKLAIDQYGALAAFYAMAREFHLADVGDIAGAAVWGKIFDATWRHRSLNDTMTVLHKNMTESNARRYLR